jgi:hypothetical protein
MALRLARRNRIARWFFVGAGLLLASQGALAILLGEPAYPNYWGGVVAPWFAIGLGGFVAITAAFLPKLFRRRVNGPSKPYGAPWEDYEKWQ